MGQNSEFMGQMDWDTYISLNAYGITSLVAGLTELIPNKFETIRKICNMATGGCLISSGVTMGINNDFTNAYAIPTIIAGASEIIHNLLPMETNRNNTELQETSFTNETAKLINDNASINSYGSNDSENVIFEVGNRFPNRNNPIKITVNPIANLHLLGSEIMTTQPILWKCMECNREFKNHSERITDNYCPYKECQDRKYIPVKIKQERSRKMELH